MFHFPQKYDWLSLLGNVDVTIYNEYGNNVTITNLPPLQGFAGGIRRRLRGLSPPPVVIPPQVCTSACNHTDTGLHLRLWSYRPFRAATLWLDTASEATARAALKGPQTTTVGETPGTQNKKKTAIQKYKATGHLTLFDEEERQ